MNKKKLQTVESTTREEAKQLSDDVLKMFYNEYMARVKRRLYWEKKEGKACNN